MVAHLAAIPWPRGRTGRARTRVSVETGNRQVLATATLRGAANRQPLATGARLAAATPAARRAPVASGCLLAAPRRVAVARTCLLPVSTLTLVLARPVLPRGHGIAAR